MTETAVGSIVLPRRTLGRTGLQASVLGFGTGDNAGLMVTGSPSEREHAVAEAIAASVNYFDTAPSYGNGRAEENLGRALRGRRADVILTTKVEIMPADRHRLARRVKDSLAASLRRLQTDHVDIVMIHNPPKKANRWDYLVWTPLTIDDYRRADGALEGLSDVIDAGMARFGGIACEGVEGDSLRPLLSEPLIHVLNVWLNVLNPSALLPRSEDHVHGVVDYRGLADDAAHNNVGIAAFRVLAGGAAMAAASGSLERHPYAGGFYARNTRRFEAEVRMATQMVQGLGLSGPDAVAECFHRYAITDERVATLIGGFSELHHLKAAIRAMEAGPLTSAERERIETAWMKIFTTKEAAQ
jgi:aryl-alcohol dehydrogenase-like predicted oxidoreductase